jgi:hypothetical protein
MLVSFTMATHFDGTTDSPGYLERFNATLFIWAHGKREALDLEQGLAFVACSDARMN